MLFLQSPYQFPDDLAALHGEIIGFQGFKASTEVILSCERRHIPKSLLVLLERLLHVSPEMRPSAERVKVAVEDFTRRGTGRSWSKVWGARGAPSKTSMETTQQRKVSETVWECINARLQSDLQTISPRQLRPFWLFLPRQRQGNLAQFRLIQTFRSLAPTKFQFRIPALFFL